MIGDTPSPERPGGNVFLDPKSRSARLYEEASRYIPGGTSKANAFFRPYPFYAGFGRGCHFVDADGVDRLDFLNNFTALIHGHADPETMAAVSDQLARGSAFSASCEEEIELARLLVERVPSVEKIRFFNSGTEAVMMAVKAARAFTGKHKLAKFEGAYHGYYDYVQVSYASSAPHWGPREEPRSLPSSDGLAPSVMEDVVVLPYNDREAAERILSKHKDELAALIVDPLSNRMGFVPPREGFLTYLRELTRALGIVLIFDEVISFRISYSGAQGFYGVEPDLTAFGKIIGGGFPVGATGGKAEIMEVFDPSGGKLRVACGGTFSGNPVSMTAGLATMRQLTPQAYERLAALGARLRARANEIYAATRFPGQVTGEGSLFRLVPVSGELVDYRDVVPDAVSAAAWSRLFLALLDEGIIVNPNGLGALSTPMGEDEVDTFVLALERAIAKVQAED